MRIGIIFMEVSCDYMAQFLNNISDFLNQFRKWYENQNIRQEDIAEQLGITRWHLSKVLNQRTMPSLKLLETMEEVMQNDR